MAYPAEHNVVWYGPGYDANDSVPLGNGEIGINAWVEPQGDLVFYLARTDAWDDNGRLLKIGRVRVTLDPVPDPAHLRQTLDLTTGTWRVQYGSWRESGQDWQVEVKLWVDAHRPFVNVDIAASHSLSAIARIEMWRTERAELDSLEVSDIMLDRDRVDHKHGPTFVEPDCLFASDRKLIGWYHHNVQSNGPALTAHLQGLEGFSRPDPLQGRTFGAAIQAKPAGEARDDQHLQTAQGQEIGFRICVLTIHPAAPAQFRQQIGHTCAAYGQEDPVVRRQAHCAWWQAFWARSHIAVSGREPAIAAEARRVSQAYALQRYVQACAGRGRYPIKFNGSLFTVPYPGQPGDADYRRWGPGYWWQNTRLPYFNMCAAGDYEMLQPLFRMYAQDFRELWRYRTRRYFGHDGIFFSECVYFWGDVFTETYGWTPFAEREDPLQESRYHKWEWVGGLELAWLMLDCHAHLQDHAFLTETALPFIHQVLIFFDGYYDVNESGQWVMHPSQSLETWWECTNPMPEIAGLRAVLQRLLDLPAELTPPDLRDAWQMLLGKVPPLPTREEHGTRMLAPADAYALRRNVENAELYAVFPFRLLAFESPDKDLALEAFRARKFRGHYGWRQNDLFCAYLGLAESARRAVVQRAGTRNHDCQGAQDPARAMQNRARFPGFWGPNFDWFPDQCHGGVLNTALQAMLLQAEGDRIYLLPAWPAGWDVEFKLHAPLGTVIEGVVADGDLTFEISPSARRKDVVVCQ